MTKMTNQIKEHHSLLTQVLFEQLDPRKSKIILCCSVSPAISQFRHSLTALKFTSKIREVISKKLSKEKASQSKVNSSKAGNFSSLVNISSEIINMSSTLGEVNQRDSANSGDLLMRFNTLRQKYEDCLAQSKRRERK